MNVRLIISCFFLVLIMPLTMMARKPVKRKPAAKSAPAKKTSKGGKSTKSSKTAKSTKGAKSARSSKSSHAQAAHHSSHRSKPWGEVEATNDESGVEESVVNIPITYEFPGGIDSLRRYFLYELRPTQAILNSRIQGEVMVRATLDTNGNVMLAYVENPISMEWSKVVVRAVLRMPTWTCNSFGRRRRQTQVRFPVNCHLPEKLLQAAPTTQPVIVTKTVVPDPVKSAPAETSFRMVEKAAEFPGGDEALMRFLARQIQYPKKAKRKNIQGKVTAEFVIDKEGIVKDIHILQGLGFGCDEEVLRVLMMMPRWKPAEQAGKKVSSTYSLPVNFALQ
jgi:TonB family protein